MRAQRLWGARFDTPREVVRWLGALQAQEFGLAKWSIAQRTRGATKADIEQAFADGVILRTHVLRPTWHFVLADDIRWILKATAPRVRALNAYYERQFKLDAKLLKKSNSVIAKALEGGTHLTRRELQAALRSVGIRAEGPRLAYIVMSAELDALVCSGAMRGKQHTYALLDERAPNTKTLDRDEALAELTRRYFTSRGPATLNDYVRWSSLTAAEGREALALVSELESRVEDGKTFWFGPGSVAGNASKPVVDLVQGYDELIMSYSESRDESFRASKVSNAPFYHAVLLDGRLVGHWKPVTTRRAVRIRTVLRRSLTPGEAKALSAAVSLTTAWMQGK